MERILCRAEVRNVTGSCQHTVGGNLMQPPHSVEIVSSDDGYFLYYLDEGGGRMTDTWHTTLDDAKAQAAFEFEIQEHEWKSVQRMT